MDELQISGKRYISSRRIAKENGYHTDYIGQLIRANKIKGQKVGRAWYVEADSFATFLGLPAQSGEEVEAPTQPSATGYAVSSAEETAEVLAPPRSQPPVAEVVSAPTDPEPEIAAPAVAAQSEPTPIVVHVQPGYIPSVPFTQSQPNVEVAKRAQSAQPITEDEYSVPLRKVAPQPASGLRYVAESPSLPEISHSKPITRTMPKLEVEEAEPEPMHAPVAVITESAPRIWRKVAVLGVAAIAIFALSAVVSSGLLQTINIQAGDPASVGYTIHW